MGTGRTTGYEVGASGTPGDKVGADRTSGDMRGAASTPGVMTGVLCGMADEAKQAEQCRRSALTWSGLNSTAASEPGSGDVTLPGSRGRSTGAAASSGSEVCGLYYRAGLLAYRNL